MKVLLLEEALADLVDGYRFYQRQSAGLGTYFPDSLVRHGFPGFLGGVHGVYLGYQRLLSKRFPFAVYYRQERDTVRVYAVLDCRRNPSWIRNKLK